MIDLATREEVQTLDRDATARYGVPSLLLMENAGRGAAEELVKRLKPGDRCAIFVGKGNNGGDGYTLARHLASRGFFAEIYRLSKAGDIKGDAKIQREIVQDSGMNEVDISTAAAFREQKAPLRKFDWFIDGILGIGLSSPLSGLYKEVVDFINKSSKKVAALDIATGLDSNTGQVLGAAVWADLTLTFGMVKVGQIVYPGADFTGDLRVIDIGWPGQLLRKRKPSRFLITASDIRARILPRDPKTHKGRAGHVYLLAGSRGKMGAAALAGFGVLRSGAGLLTIGCPEGSQSDVVKKLLEAMTEPLPETEEGTISLKALPQILKSLEGKEVLAVGPGLSENRETVELIQQLVQKTEIPTVVDADGLNALAKKISVLKRVKNDLILTPHPGEFSRLTGVPTAEGEIDRIGWATRFSQKHKVVVILKGARTVTASPSGEAYINPTGNPGMATAGMGDLLTGIISGFLAQGLAPLDAAIVATYLHGASGDDVAERKGERGLMTSDLLEVLPKIIQKHTSPKGKNV